MIKNHFLGRLLLLNHVAEIAMPYHGVDGLGSAFHKHFVLGINDAKYLFPFTHQPKTYRLIDNILISNIMGGPDPQYMCPFPHDWSRDLYTLQASPMLDKYYREHRENIEKNIENILGAGIPTMSLIRDIDAFLAAPELIRSTNTRLLKIKKW